MVNGRSMVRIGCLAAILAGAGGDQYFNSQKIDYYPWNSQSVRVRFEVQPAGFYSRIPDDYSAKLTRVYHAERERRERIDRINQDYTNLSDFSKAVWSAGAMALLFSYIPNARKLANRWTKKVRRDTHQSRKLEFTTSSWDRLDTPYRLREETTAPVRLDLH